MQQPAPEHGATTTRQNSPSEPQGGLAAGILEPQKAWSFTCDKVSEVKIVHQHDAGNARHGWRNLPLEEGVRWPCKQQRTECSLEWQKLVSVPVSAT
jgi:hypothetical protein